MMEFMNLKQEGAFFFMKIEFMNLRQEELFF